VQFAARAGERTGLGNGLHNLELAEIHASDNISMLHEVRDHHANLT
jgi:hypothetical protein